MPVMKLRLGGCAVVDMRDGRILSRGSTTIEALHGARNELDAQPKLLDATHALMTGGDTHAAMLTVQSAKSVYDVWGTTAEQEIELSTPGIKWNRDTGTPFWRVE